MDERREFVRCDLSIAVKYKLTSGPDIEKGCLSADISCAGMKMIIPEKLERASKLQLSFHLPDEKREISTRGTVAWIKGAGDNLFEAGIEFLEIKEEDKIIISRFVKRNLGLE